MRELPLFADNSCFVEENPKIAGFYECEGSDGQRWIKPKAVCRCRLNPDLAYAEPHLKIRAHTRKAEWGPYLMPFVEGQRIGLKQVPQYGTYYFPFSPELLAQRTGDSVEVRLETLCGPETVSDNLRDLALAVFEVRIVDFSCEDFPERQEFLLQRKIFERGPGGLAADILSQHPFRPTDRILDLGAGTGWTTVLLAGFSGASAWGLDLYDYSFMGRPSFKTDLLERIDRHRSVLPPVAPLASMADRAVLEKTIGRCDFTTANAEQMPWRDNYFDFVFSLNVMEHVGQPERVLAEIRRVLRPGGRALIQFSPLYHSDVGSHLPAVLAYNRPWSQLLMTREEIREAIRPDGGRSHMVDEILDTLNGWKPGQFIQVFENSGLNVLAKSIYRGFVLPGSEQSPEYRVLRARYSEEDLTTILMLWHLEKPL